MTTATASTTTKTSKKTANVDIPEEQPSWLRSWDPDQRWLHPYIAGSWLWSVSWVPEISHLSPWWMTAAGAGSTLIARWAATRRAPADVFGISHTNQIRSLATACGAAATGWLTWAGLTSPLNPPVVGSLLLGTLLGGGLYAGWRSAGPGRQRATTTAQAVAEEVELRSEWSHILTSAGIKGMVVIDRANNRAGYTLTLENRGDGTVTVDQITSAVKPIAAAASRALAHTGAVIGPRGIRAEETEWAHRILLHVTTLDVLKASIPYEPRTRPASIADRIDIGLYDVGDPVELVLAQTHAKIVGASRKGKSVLLTTIMGRLLECEDVLLWVGGTQKLIPLVYSWLLPWITGATRRPILDYVAGEDIRHVLMMLADMYTAAKERASLLTTETKLIASHRLPAIVGLIDEASGVLTRPETIEVDGKQKTASELVCDICQIGGAVNVTLLLATQFGLYDSFGTFGSEIHRNLQLRIALQTLSDSDGRNTLIGMDSIDTTKLKNKSMLIQPDIDDPRALPAKAYHLEGATLVEPRSRACTPHVAYLDSFTRDRLRFYAGRWSAERQTTLITAIKGERLPVPDLAAAARACEGDSTTTINDRFNEIIEMEGIDTVNTDQTPTPADDDAPKFGDSSKPIGAGIEEFEANMKRINEQMGAVWRIAQPLLGVAEALSMPNAPKGDTFVPTGQLAIVTDRVAADAPDAEVAAAAVALGRDLNRQCPALKSVQVSRDGKQVRGYTVDRLWDAIHWVAYGKPMPDADE
ncbi:MAG: hypothetical protein JXA67_07315 [Micromonosporaceae bacterium]|nr:hypothetical protein [Micromonosporaceae bacterium]